MKVCFLSCFSFGGDEAGDAGLTDLFQHMLSHLASCGLFITFLDWEEDTEPSSSIPRPPSTLPRGQPCQGSPGFCQSVPTHLPQHWEDCWSLEANSAPGPMGTASQAPLLLKQRDHMDKGAPKAEPRSCSFASRGLPGQQLPAPLHAQQTDTHRNPNVLFNLFML